MKLKNSQLLVIRQLDKKLKSYSDLIKTPSPTLGWINVLRTTLNMSLRQLGKRLNMSAQGVKDLEKREADGSITLKSLREAGESLHMKLVYSFIPIEGSLEKMIEDKSRKMAIKIVTRTSMTMSLEDQSNSEKRLKQAIEELTQEIKKEMPKTLWD